MEFIEWLQKEKNYKEKTSHDIVSRLKRVKQFLGTVDEPIVALNGIENNKDFKCLTHSVRSQLRKALKLYEEYQKFSRY